MAFNKLHNFPLYCRNFVYVPVTVKSAGILGDELLKGQVIDANTPHITKQLYNLGIRVKKVRKALKAEEVNLTQNEFKQISIIGDEVNQISREVSAFSKSYNYVITTGGIGPTHDDVTYEAVAKAFNVPLVLNSYLLELCIRFYKSQDINHPGMKLAKIPETAILTFSDGNRFPNVSVENVYMFPGVPELFLRSFTKLCTQLFKSGDTFYTKCIYVTLSEDKIAKELQQLVIKFSDVHVGSYPKLFEKSYKVRITMESTNENSVNEAYHTLLRQFPKEVIVNIHE